MAPVHGCSATGCIRPPPRSREAGRTVCALRFCQPARHTQGPASLLDPDKTWIVNMIRQILPALCGLGQRPLAPARWPAGVSGKDGTGSGLSPAAPKCAPFSGLSCPGSQRTVPSADALRTEIGYCCFSSILSQQLSHRGERLSIRGTTYFCALDTSIHGRHAFPTAHIHHIPRSVTDP
jgi:hypothetical protein